MDLDITILSDAFPALVILMVAEVIYMIKENRHDYKDTFTSISMSLGRLPLSIFSKGLILFLYTLVYQYRLFSIPDNKWWAWAICFFCDDFSYYWFHRMSHKVRFLWASHKVHHTSEKFNLSTALRVPWTSDLTGVFLFWGWMPFIGIEPYMVIFMKSTSVIYQFIMHTETIGKCPKWFEAVFNTPSHHRVHHGSNVEYLDKNHAGTLIIWDKIFGTYKEEIFTPKYGLAEELKSFNPFVIAFHEWRKMFSDFKKAKSFKDRLNYFFNSPGWSHNNTSKTAKQLQTDLKSCKNNDHLIPLTTQFKIKKTVMKKNPRSTRKVNRVMRYASILLFTSFIAMPAFTQERKLVYDVIRNEKVIGEIVFLESIKDGKKMLSLTSDVKTKFIFSFSSYIAETASFENGIMIYSSYYQKQNGSDKTKKITVASGQFYKLIDDGDSKLISCSAIRYNMLLLYTNVPEKINKVYSDNYQKLLDIRKVAGNKYKIILPGGDCNYYTYENNVCTRVDVERTFFTVHFVLRNKQIEPFDAKL